MLRRRAQSYVFCCLAVVAISVGPAYGRFIPKISVFAAKDGSGYLLVNGRSAAHLLTSNAGLSPAERVVRAAERMTILVEKGLGPESIRTEKAGRTIRVMAGKTLIMVVTKVEARAHQTAPAALASLWASNLKKLLALPPLSVSPTSLTVPLGEDRSVAVQCLMPDEIQVVVSDPKVVSVDLKRKPAAIVVNGASVGDSTITLKCREYSESVSVSVKKYAAFLPSGARKTVVTGSECPASLIVEAARCAAMQAVSLEDGAAINSVFAPPSVQSLMAGQSAGVPIQVEATGQGYIPIRLPVTIQVENQSLPRTPTSWIMYSNNPERVEKYQTLFTGRLDPGSGAIRLLYHHQNMMERKVGFVIEVFNPSPNPATLHVVEGKADPMLNTVVVGYEAGLKFMRNQQNSIGRVCDIPPNSRQVLVSQSLGHEYTASGIMEFRHLSGDSLVLRVTAEPEYQRASDDSSEIPVPTAWTSPQTVALSNDVYPNPVKDVDVTYTAGRPWVFFRLGNEGIKHASQDLRLIGNYGVTYQIRAKVENPSDESVTAEVVFEATAGPASGVFFVDGNLVRIRYIAPPDEVTIGRITVPAGKTRVLSIRTIPLSGSAYPAMLIIRPAGTTVGRGG